MRTFVRLSAAVLALSLTALAELGGTVSSIEVDRQRVKGTRVVQQRSAYTVHEIKTPGDGVIREYVSPQGKVFAVAYEGPFPGESNGLLGGYSATVEQLRAGHTGPKRIAGIVHYEAPGLVYRAAGHMGYYHMTAYTSDSLPSGVTVEEIQ